MQNKQLCITNTVQNISLHISIENNKISEVFQMPRRRSDTKNSNLFPAFLRPDLIKIHVLVSNTRVCKAFTVRLRFRVQHSKKKREK